MQPKIVLLMQEKYIWIKRQLHKHVQTVSLIHVMTYQLAIC